MTDLDLFEILLLATRWIHAVGAVAWVGGSILFAFVLRPVGALEPDGMRAVMPHVSRYYRELVDISVVAIIFSGLILTLDRLSDEAATGTYGAVLGVKLGIAVLMFIQMWNLRQSDNSLDSGPRWTRKLSWLLGYNALVFLGVIVYLLANLLAILFDDGLRAVS
ncbi:MAG: hypothetical protein HQ478_03710 [Chloroflexi bacterium]|nr:hypothetical protein [Chloroflexota bacterium]